MKLVHLVCFITKKLVSGSHFIVTILTAAAAAAAAAAATAAAAAYWLSGSECIKPPSKI